MTATSAAPSAPAPLGDGDEAGAPLPDPLPEGRLESSTAALGLARVAGVRPRAAGRADTTARVVRAVVEVLEESGVSGLTTTRVARAARVHRATVLRRWPRPENLLAEAARGMGALEVTAPNTGSLAGDLLAYITLAERHAEAHRPLMRALLGSDLGCRGEAAEMLQRHFATSEDALAEVLRRARLRGNRVHERSAPAVHSVIGGAILLQTVIRQSSLNGSELDRLVGAALAAARPGAGVVAGSGATGAVPTGRLH